jgi:hypothetical protein
MRRAAFTCDPCYSRYHRGYGDSGIVIPVTGAKWVGLPDNTLAWQDPYDTDWALPDFRKKTPWLLLGVAAAVGAYLWSSR